MSLATMAAMANVSIGGHYFLSVRVCPAECECVVQEVLLGCGNINVSLDVALVYPGAVSWER